ncbi:MAG: ABC transporter ATP-binding protein [Chloroflexi bacterium]|nr:ABC transporter ATP-binding protein [Chloroflexota bacterium]
MNTIIEMQGIVKVFPPNVVALNDVSVDFREGEIHAIVGENGAGKSTLMKILYGMQPANSGRIRYRGQDAIFHDPGEAIANGIGMVHQEIILIPEYTVWQNVVLGVEPVGLFGRIDEKEARRRVQARIQEFNFNLAVDAEVGDISVAARQKVEILKLLYRDVSVLIMDEPTAVLTPQEIPQLFNELRRLRDNGHTILFISHRLDEVMELSDRITVLRRGRKIGTVDTADTSKEQLAQMMVGREVIFSPLRQEQQIGDVVADIQGITYIDAMKRERLKDISIRVRASEIVGVAGVEGNGQFELVNVLMGLLKPTSGEFFVCGERLTHASILDRRKKIAFVSQDRASMGACLSASIMENVLMTHHRLNKRFSKFGGLVLDYAQANRFTEEVRQKLDVQMDSRQAVFRSLSGGNQQKVILGRELSLGAPFILLDQPTRGLDVGSIEYVHQQILRMRAESYALLMLSSDLDELFRISDRIVVLHRGRIVADLITAETSITEVGYFMLEGKPNATKID